MNIKGSLPLLILHTLSTGSKHGYRIAKEIKEKSQGALAVSEGTLYPMLHNLEKRGFIEAFEEEVKGRTRRCYRLTESGQGELAKERAAWQQYTHSVNLVLGGGVIMNQLKPDLQHWLETATCDVSPEVADQTRSELVAHYEDAVDAYREQGMSEGQAHQRAMADLGLAEVVSDGFNEVHRGQSTYVAAFTTSVVVLLALTVLPVLYMMLGFTDFSTEGLLFITLNDIIFTGGTFYVLFALRRLFSWRLGLRGLDGLFWAIVLAQGVVIVCDVLYRFAYRDALYLSAESAFRAESLTRGLLILPVNVGNAVVGGGLFVIALHLFRQGKNLYGLGKPIGAFVAALSFSLVTVSIWASLNMQVMVALAEVNAVFSHYLMWPFLILLFFRLAYRSPVHPRRFA